MAIRTTERCAVLACIAAPCTLADVVLRTGIEYKQARHALGYFVRARMATYTTVRASHCRRPVAVYVASDATTTELPAPAAWAQLSQAWR